MDGLRDTIKALFDATKSMFVREDGSVKWNTLIGIGLGAAIGGFILPLEGLGLISAVMGAGVGLMGSQALEKIQAFIPQPVPVAAETPAIPAPKGHSPEVETGPGGELPPKPHTPKTTKKSL